MVASTAVTGIALAVGSTVPAGSTVGAEVVSMAVADSTVEGTGKASPSTQ
jgi:hypothetical protein